MHVDKQMFAEYAEKSRKKLMAGNSADSTELFTENRLFYAFIYENIFIASLTGNGFRIGRV